MKKYYFLIVVMAFFTFAGNLMVEAQWRASHHGFHPQPAGQKTRPHPNQPGPKHLPFGAPPVFPPPHILVEIETPESMIKDLEELRCEFRKKLIDLQSRVAMAELELEKVMRSDKPSEKEVENAVDALHDARGAMFRTEMLTRVQVRKTLGEELFQKLRMQRQHHKKRCLPKSEGNLG